jgi:hypothetical protein
MGVRSDLMVSLDSIISAGSDQLSCDVQGETAILHVREGVYYGLDGVGTRVWELIQQPIRVRDLCDRLVAEFEVERAQCEGDLLQLLDDLNAAGLIRIEDGTD